VISGGVGKKVNVEKFGVTHLYWFFFSHSVRLRATFTRFIIIIFFPFYYYYIIITYGARGNDGSGSFQAMNVGDCGCGSPATTRDMLTRRRRRRRTYTTGFPPSHRHRSATAYNMINCFITWRRS
jgi:hypothetical protein